mmetsp:Transcript_25390/g.50578  ORF Transcript_25390/g.50578 Transcript_25390/m.50578 type:complete len:181 (-) Transcript_25390:487-1029(-)
MRFFLAALRNPCDGTLWNIPVTATGHHLSPDQVEIVEVSPWRRLVCVLDMSKKTQGQYIIRFRVLRTAPGRIPLLLCAANFINLPVAKKYPEFFCPPQTNLTHVLTLLLILRAYIITSHFVSNAVHPGACQEYVTCIKKAQKSSHAECRDLSKNYLQCRMDNGLMAKENLEKMGFEKKEK